MRKGNPLLWGLIIIATLVLPTGASSAAPLLNGEASRIVVVNEIAWGGTAASPDDEWIELYNTTDSDIDLGGWTLTAVGEEWSGITIEDGKVIPAQGYFLLERNEEAVSDVAADQVYDSFQMSDAGEILELRDAGWALVDTANKNGEAWPAGTVAPGYHSMERVIPSVADIVENWVSNDGVTRMGLDASGNPINGTPRARNSATVTPSVITLISFTASPDHGTVTLEWETASEIDNAGFNLYRAPFEEGTYKRINDALIPATGDVVSGASYSFVDTTGFGIFYYKLEDIDYYGVSTLHGPLRVRVAHVFRPIPPGPIYRRIKGVACCAR